MSSEWLETKITREKPPIFSRSQLPPGTRAGRGTTRPAFRAQTAHFTTSGTGSARGKSYFGVI